MGQPVSFSGTRAFAPLASAASAFACGVGVGVLVVVGVSFWTFGAVAGVVALGKRVLGSGLGLEVGGVAAASVGACFASVACSCCDGVIVAGVAHVHSGLEGLSVEEVRVEVGHDAWLAGGGIPVAVSVVCAGSGPHPASVGLLGDAAPEAGEFCSVRGDGGHAGL